MSNTRARSSTVSSVAPQSPRSSVASPRSSSSSNKGFLKKLKKWKSKDEVWGCAGECDLDWDCSTVKDRKVPAPLNLQATLYENPSYSDSTISSSGSSRDAERLQAETQDALSAIADYMTRESTKRGGSLSSAENSPVEILFSQNRDSYQSQGENFPPPPSYVGSMRRRTNDSLPSYRSQPPSPVIVQGQFGNDVTEKPMPPLPAEGLITHPTLHIQKPHDRSYGFI